MAGCTKTWLRRIAAEVQPAYPQALIVIARAYGQPRTLPRSEGGGTFTIPAVQPDPRGFPLRYVRQFLASAYGPDEARHDLVVMFHPCGGFSWTRQSSQ